MNEAQWSCVLFDVDGTLVDSAAVVIDVFEITLSHYGLTVPSREDLRVHVGPPLWDSIQDLGLDGDITEEAIAFYRSHYIKRFLEPPLFPGVADMLHTLHKAGIPLATATSKQEPMARGQMEHLGLDTVFNVIAGATPDPDCTKATVIADALARLEAQGCDTSAPLLIGDRFWDIEGGAEAGVPVAGVTWGYAQPGELDPAIELWDSPEEATEYLLRTCQGHH